MGSLPVSTLASARRPLPTVVILLCERGTPVADSPLSTESPPLRWRHGLRQNANPSPDPALYTPPATEPGRDLWFVLSGAILYYFASPGFSGNFAPAWAVRPTQEQEEANVRISRKAHVVAVSEKGSKEGPLVEIDIQLPYLTNTKVLRKGDELRLFVAKPQQEEGVKRGLKRDVGALFVS